MVGISPVIWPMNHLHFRGCTSKNALEAKATLPFYDQAIPNPPSKSLVKMGVMGIYLWVIMGFKWDMI